MGRFVIRFTTLVGYNLIELDYNNKGITQSLYRHFLLLNNCDSRGCLNNMNGAWIIGIKIQSRNKHHNPMVLISQIPIISVV